MKKHRSSSSINISSPKKVDKRIFGSFIEQLGRAVYEGIYRGQLAV